MEAPYREEMLRAISQGKTFRTVTYSEELGTSVLRQYVPIPHRGE